MSRRQSEGLDWSCELPDSIFSLPFAADRRCSVTRSALTRRSPASQEAGTPSAANMENMVMFDSPGKGRGLKATKEFWAGDVIFSEPSLAAVVFDRYGNDVIHGSECFDAEICAAILQNCLLSSSSYVVFPSLNRLDVVLRIFCSVPGRDTLIIDTMRLAGLVWGLFNFGCLPSTFL